MSINTHYGALLQDEISLEGRSGITIPGLWKRIELKVGIAPPPPLQRKLWDFAKSLKSVEYYVSPADRENGDSRATYDTLENVTGSVRCMSLEECLERWGENLVAVASRMARWKALAPGHLITCVDYLPPVQYDLLEKIGRSRSEGERSFECDGRVADFKANKCEKSSLKSAKSSFYLRKLLLQMEIIWQDNCLINNKSVILLKLARFRKKMNRLKPEEEKNVKLIKSFIDEGSGRTSFVKVKDALGFSRKALTHNITGRFPYCDLFEIEKQVFNNVQRNYIRARRKSRVINLDTPPTDYDWDATFTPGEEIKEEPKPKEDDEDGPWNREVPMKQRHKQPMMRRVYLTIKSFGPDGATLLEISKALGNGWNLGRSACRSLQKCHGIKHYSVDAGKLRYSRYYAKCFDRESKVMSLMGIECDRLAKNMISFHYNQSNTVEVGDFTMVTEGIEISLKPYARMLKDQELANLLEQAISKRRRRKGLRYSQRYLTRTNVILEVLLKYGIVCELNQLKKLASYHQNEIKDMVSAIDRMDRKVIFNHLNQLYSVGMLQLYNVNMTMKNRQRTRLLIAMPDLKIDEQRLKKALEPDLRGFYLSDLDKQNTNTIENRRPKMERIRVTHEFMFQLAWGEIVNTTMDEVKMPDHRVTVSGQVYDPKKERERPNFNEVKLNQHVKPLTDAQISVPTDLHLSPPSGWPAGWINIVEMVNCIPKHMFTLMSPLTDSSMIISAIRSNIVFTSNMGLTFMDEKREHVYVNRNAIFLEKTDHTKREHKFHFSSMKAVKLYWDVLRLTVMKNITAVARHSSGNQIIDRSIIRLISPTMQPEEAPLADVGILPGNGSGFAGFDSSITLSKKATWHRYITPTNLKICPQRKRPCLPRDAPSAPKKTRPKQVHIKPYIDKRKRPFVKQEKKKSEVPLPRRKHVWKPEEIHLVHLARVAAALLLSSHTTTLRNRAHMRTLVLNMCEETFRASGRPHILRPFIMRRLNLLANNHQMQRVIEEKLTEARDLSALQKYIGYYHHLRAASPKLYEARSKFHIVILELILALHRAHFLKNVTSMKVFPDLETLHKNYRINSHKRPPLYLKEPKDAESIESATIQNAAIAVLGSSDERSWAPLLLKIPEVKLRAAIKFLQSESMVALRNKFYRLSQYYLATVTPLNLFTIALQTDLESASAGLMGLKHSDLDGLPNFEKKTLYETDKNKRQNRCGNDDLNIMPLFSKFLVETIVNSGQKGCTANQLKEALQKSELCHEELGGICLKCLKLVDACLATLIADKTIYKVGNDVIRWVSRNYDSLWTVDGVNPHPWTKADGSVADSSFFRWMGTVLWCILDKPGISCMDLCLQLRLLRPAHLGSLIDKLTDIGSVYVQMIQVEECSLTSEDCSHIIYRPSVSLDNLENVIIIPTQQAVSLYEAYKKTIRFCDAFNSKIEIS